MQPNRFDAWTRSIATSSRRNLFKAFGSTLLGGMLPFASSSVAEAASQPQLVKNINSPDLLLNFAQQDATYSSVENFLSSTGFTSSGSSAAIFRTAAKATGAILSTSFVNGDQTAKVSMAVTLPRNTPMSANGPRQEDLAGATQTLTAGVVIRQNTPVATIRPGAKNAVGGMNPIIIDDTDRRFACDLCTTYCATQPNVAAELSSQDCAFIATTVAYACGVVTVETGPGAVVAFEACLAGMAFLCAINAASGPACAFNPCQSVCNITCPPGFITCTATCVNSACGQNACTSAATGSLMVCTDPQTRQFICSDVSADPHNCGSCGHQCGANETCVGRTCSQTSGGTVPVTCSDGRQLQVRPPSSSCDATCQQAYYLGWCNCTKICGGTCCSANPAYYQKDTVICAILGLECA